jgi:tetratricopeptide (TPR) repeat protein
MERTVLEAVIPNPSSVSPHSWARRVRGDLDHVVQKALEKEAGRRYPTADALQADIRSYLDGLPVSARRPSVVYAAWRALYRRRAAAVAVLATLLAAGGTYAFGAARQRAAAIRAAEERAVVAEVLADVLGALDGPNGSVPETDAILRTALRAIQRVASRPIYEAELLSLVASRYEALGRHGDAISLYERSVRLETQYRPGHPAHTEALSGLGRALVVRRPESRARDYVTADSVLTVAWRQAATTFGPTSPNAASIQAHLGALHYYTRSYELAAEYCSNSRTLLSRALADSTTWATNETRVAASRGAWLGYSMRRPFRRRVTQDLSYATMYLGYAELAMGRPRASIPLLEQVVAYQLENEPYAYVTGAALDALAGAYFEVNDYLRFGLLVAPLLYSGKTNEALATAREAVDIATATRDSLEVIWQLYNLAYVLRFSGNGAGALAVLDTLLSRIDETTSEHPALPGHRVGAIAERSAALLLLGDQASAEREARRSVRLASQTDGALIRGHAGVTLAEALLARGAYNDVVRTLLPLYELHQQSHIPGNPSLQAVRMARCLARAFQGLGVRDRARFFDREAVRRAPSQAETH